MSIKAKGMCFAIGAVMFAMAIAPGLADAAMTDVYVTRPAGALSKITAGGTFLGTASVSSVVNSAYNPISQEVLSNRGTVLSRFRDNDPTPGVFDANDFLGNINLSYLASHVAVSPITGDIYVGSTTNGRVDRYSSAGAYIGAVTGLGSVTALEVNSNGNVIIARGDYISNFNPELTVNVNSNPFGATITDIAVNSFGDILVTRGTTAVTLFRADLTFVGNANASTTAFVASSYTGSDFYVGRSEGAVSRFDRDLVFLGTQGTLDTVTALAVNGNEVLVARGGGISRLNAGGDWLGGSPFIGNVPGSFDSINDLDPVFASIPVPEPTTLGVFSLLAVMTIRRTRR